MALTTEINKNPKVLMNFKRPQVRPKQSRKKKQSWRTYTFQFQTSYKLQ